MMLVDANVLIYAYYSSSPLHTAAKQWFQKTLSGTEPIRLAWLTILAFLRITTHRTIFANPYSISEAAALVNAWLAQPCMGILQPTARHWPILTQLLQDGQATGPPVMDTHLAALAIEHGAMLYSTDKDFTRLASLNLQIRLLPPVKQSACGSSDVNHAETSAASSAGRVAEIRKKGEHQ